MLSNLDPQAPRTVVTGTNWRGMWTLYNREVHRYLKIFGQTLLAPIITMLLFLIVFGVVFGGERKIGGLTYVEFLAPGLLMMAILQNAFANTSTSIISQKINECIVDSLMPPLSAMELTIGFVLGGATRGLMVAVAVGATLVLITPISFHHPFIIMFYAISAALMMGATGMITGVWAEKFDHVSTVTNFIILPLSFLSGTFFPISRFPEFLQTINNFNPIFYLIDGLRYGFTGELSASIEVGIIYIIAFNVCLLIICQRMLLTGYKIKD